MAESTANGMESFNAQEKSTIKIETARVTFLVRSQVKSVPPKLQGTKTSARREAFFSSFDFSFSDSSIIETIRS